MVINLKMKKINLLIFAFIFLASFSFAQTTWNKNVSCIIYSHCTGCHNPNGLAPFSLTTFNETYNYRNSMVSVIESRKMPPHLPDPNYSHFAGENVLKENEIQLIKRLKGLIGKYNKKYKKKLTGEINYIQFIY